LEHSKGFISQLNSPMSSTSPVPIETERSDVPIPIMDSFRSVVDTNLASIDPGDLLQQLLDLSVETFQIQIHPDKRDYLFRDKFFEPKYIQAVEPDETSMLVSAEYVATLYTALGIFNKSTTSTIAKFKPFHFGSDSAYKLPLNEEICSGFSKELYILQDYPLISSEVSITGAVEVPEPHPKITRSSIRAFYGGYETIKDFKLKNGDLIFFNEMTEIGESIRKITNSDSCTRVSMVVTFPGVSDIFLYEAPPFFFKRSEINEPDCKILEGNIISLQSALRSRCLSSVLVRRLHREKLEDSHTRDVNRVYAYLSMSEDNDDPVRQRIFQVFETMTEYNHEIRMDVSSIFSGFYVAQAYSQLGLISENDTNKMMYFTAKRFAGDFKLENWFYLGPVEVLL
jgi:hypothetical protein